MSMKFAMHKPVSLRVHLNYGQLTCMDVYRAVSNSGQNEPFGASYADSRPQPEGCHFLHGITLKNLVEWHESGRLNDQEFNQVFQMHDVVKQDLVLVWTTTAKIRYC